MQISSARLEKENRIKKGVERNLQRKWRTISWKFSRNDRRHTIEDSCPIQWQGRNKTEIELLGYCQISSLCYFPWFKRQSLFYSSRNWCYLLTSSSLRCTSHTAWVGTNCLLKQSQHLFRNKKVIKSQIWTDWGKEVDSVIKIYFPNKNWFLEF